MPVICFSGFLLFLKNAIFVLGFVSSNSLFPEPLTPEEENKYLRIIY